MKIGREEILEVISLWPFPVEQHEQIRELICHAPLDEGAWLFRYYGSMPSKVAQLEQSFAVACGSQHALAVNSGTSALIAALAACGIGPGDDVLIPAYTFIATAAAVVIAGAVPNIVEVDETLTMDVTDMERKITPRTKAVIPVHMRGLPSNMKTILEVARKRGLRVIEDVAQACGGRYQGRWLGTFGDFGCFSFGQYKILSAGEGGMVITGDDYLAMRAKSYHDTAACWRPDRYAAERTAGELFAGENYRMSEVHGAVALAQLRKLEDYLTVHRLYRARLVEGLEARGIEPLRLAPSNDSSGDAAQWFVMLAPNGRFADELNKALRAQGIRAGGRFDQAKRDWHLYCFWEYILKHKTANEMNHPYCAYPIELLDYSDSACLNTLSILERAVILNIPALLESIAPEDAVTVLSNVINAVAKN